MRNRRAVESTTASAGAKEALPTRYLQRPVQAPPLAQTMNGFTVVNRDGGSRAWVSPSGRRTTRSPDDLRITDYGVDPSDPPDSG